MAHDFCCNCPSPALRWASSLRFVGLLKKCISLRHFVPAHAGSREAREMLRTVCTVIVAAILMFVAPVGAQVILSNYPQTNDTNTTADVTNLRWKALSFAMPAATGAGVGDLRVRLGDWDSPNETPIFEIRDHTGSTTAPG